jgi:parvulin-like peptidyl-prolyl isomerase
MNIFSDAFRFFTNLNKEATARHILMTGPDASSKLAKLKEELQTTPDLQTAFGELASRVKLVTFDI